MALTWMPPLWAKALLPTNGRSFIGTRLANSLTYLESVFSLLRFSPEMHGRFIFSFRMGMIAFKSALPHLSPLVTGHNRTVGIRISSNTIVQRMLALLQDGITSTSANISGELSPACIEEIPDVLLSAVDVVVDGGRTPGGSPSTIFDISSTPYKTVREGAISTKQIMNALEEDRQQDK